MSIFIRFFYCLLFMTTVISPCASFAAESINIPILCYHNFNPVKPGSMNMTPEKFESQLKWLKENGYSVIPLTEAVAYLQGKRSSVPPKSVVITADDGWKSAYTYMYPIVKKYNVPVTLFIYPQTISQSKNTMTWEELKELQQTGLFTIQSHTYDHPNFKKAKKRMSPAAYEKYVHSQFVKSKNILEEKMGTKITLMAWPFGIYNDYLEQEAAKAGYEMSFTIDYRTANRNFKPESQPRFMLLQSQPMSTFISIVKGANVKSNVMSANK